MADIAQSSGHRVRFLWDFNLGQVMQVATILFATGVFYATTEARISAAEREIKRLQEKDTEQVRDTKETVVSAETRLMTRINDERARLDQTQVRIADDIREIKTTIRDGFRDLDQKLERKADKPGR